MVTPKLFGQHLGDLTIVRVKRIGLKSLLTFSESTLLLQEMMWVSS